MAENGGGLGPSPSSAPGGGGGVRGNGGPSPILMPSGSSSKGLSGGGNAASRSKAGSNTATGGATSSSSFRGLGNGGGLSTPFSLSTIDPSLLTLQYVKEEFSLGGGGGGDGGSGGGAFGLHGPGPIDPTDPFALTNDFDMLSTTAPASTRNGGGTHGSGGGGGIESHGSMLSPLSTSPLDPPAGSAPIGLEEGLSGSFGSLSNSPFGTPATSTGSHLTSHHHHHQRQQQSFQQGTRSRQTSQPPSQQHLYSMSMPVRSGFPGLSSSHQTHATPGLSGGAGSTGSSFQSFSSGVPPPLSLMLQKDGDYTPVSEPLDILTEKRRRRRESHNAVERRRRDHINEKIQELSSLLPEFAGDAQNKPNKGTVLKRSVDYLRHIHAFTAKQMERNRELEEVLFAICQSQGIDVGSLGLSVPLGTPIEIPPMPESTPTSGVGPGGGSSMMDEGGEGLSSQQQSSAFMGGGMDD